MKEKTVVLITGILVVVFLFSSCASPQTQPAIQGTATDEPAATIPTSTPELTKTPTPTASPSPTATRLPVSLSGRLFFDIDLSGTQHEISLKYYDQLLHPPKQKQGQNSDFVKALEEYILFHPTTKDGSRIMLLEPGLSNYEVCASLDKIKAGCALSDSQGDFSITGSGVRLGDVVGITITDKTGDTTPTMIYQNRYVKPVVIPAYEMNNKKVPEQKLVQTNLMKISYPFYVFASEEKISVGLVQGFLPFPPIRGDVYIYSFFDHDPRPGYGLDWRGRTALIPKTYNHLPNKLTDNLDGVDFGGQKGDFVLSAGFGVASVKESEKSGKQVVVMVDNIPQNITYSHLDTVLVTDMQEVYAGQIIGIIGRTGKEIGAPQVHVDVGSAGFDPFGDPNGLKDQVWTRAFSPAEFP